MAETLFTGRFKTGIECHYLAISDNKGVKIYENKPDARRALEGQKLAYKHKCAPRVYSDKIKQCYFGKSKKEGYYYITEIAPYPAGCITSLNMRNEVNKLTSKLDSIGFGSDLHSLNMRRLKNGKLVGIDFGPYSYS